MTDRIIRWYEDLDVVPGFLVFFGVCFTFGVLIGAILHLLGAS